MKGLAGALKVEFIRAFRNGRLAACLTFGLIIAIIHVVFCVIPEAAEQEMYLGFAGYPLSVFNRWLGGWGASIFPVLYFTVLPLLVCIPHSDSLYVDERNGYAAQMALRCGRCCYVIAKWLSCFLVGVVVSLLPLVFDFYLTAMFLPLVPPDVSSGMYSIFAYSMLGDLFYSDVYAYLGIFALIVGSCSGLIACLPLVFTRLLPNRALVACSSFLVCMILYFLFGSSETAWLSPMTFMRPDQPVWGYSLYQVASFSICWGIGEFIALFALSRSYEGCE